MSHPSHFNEYINSKLDQPLDMINSYTDTGHQTLTSNKNYYLKIKLEGYQKKMQRAKFAIDGLKLQKQQMMSLIMKKNSSKLESSFSQKKKTLYPLHTQDS